MKKSAEKIGQLLNYEKLSNIELLNLPQIKKKDIPDYINCPKYEKAKGKIDKAMERHTGKVDRLTDEIRQMKVQIAVMKERLSEVKSTMESMCYTNPYSRGEVMDIYVDKYNRLVPINNDLIDQIRKVSDKHDDTIDKLTEAKEEAKEKLEELTLEALAVIDEDIAMVITRLEGIADNLSNGEDAEDLLVAIDVCLIGLRVYAMCDDLIDDNNARKECKEGVEKINKVFSSLCADDRVQNYMVDLYRRNTDLVQQNAAIYQQINDVLASVDQKQLDALSRPINTVLAEKFNTMFDYSKVIEQVELDKIVGKINATIDSLKSNIDKAKAFQVEDAPAIELAKSGVNAERQAKSLKATMQTNVDALDGPLTQNHFAVQIIDEAVIDDFYQKDLRVAVTALRKHIVDTIGEHNFEDVLKGGDDRFSLKKTQRAIENAELTRLQDILDKIPSHIKDLTAKITGAETDIRKANETLKENIRKAEEAFKQRVINLRSDLGSKYCVACIPVIGMFSAIGIHGKVKEFEKEFRGGNQLYKDLGNELVEKNKSMSMVAMINNLLLGTGSLIFFLVSGGPIVISGIVLVAYFITFLLLRLTGRQLEDYMEYASYKVEPTADEFRIWTDAPGTKQINAKVVGFEGNDRVRIQSPEGKNITLLIKQFCDADQELLLQIRSQMLMAESFRE